jgi:hypothetical protein
VEEGEAGELKEWGKWSESEWKMRELMVHCNFT